MSTADHDEGQRTARRSRPTRAATLERGEPPPASSSLTDAGRASGPPVVLSCGPMWLSSSSTRQGHRQCAVGILPEPTAIHRRQAVSKPANREQESPPFARPWRSVASQWRRPEARAAQPTSKAAPIAPPRSPSPATRTAGGRESLNRCGCISVEIRSAIGCPKRTPRPPPMITASTSRRLTAEAIPAPSAATARSMSSVASVSSCWRAWPQMELVRRRAAAVLHELEQIGLGALVDLAPRARLHRAATGVGLQAAAPPARAARPVAPHDGVADLPRAPATAPRLAVEDDPAAHAGAPEHAEHGVIGLARAEPELGLRRHLDVVAEVHLGARRSDRAAASSKGSSQLGRLRALATVPAASSTSPGEPTPIPCSFAGSTPAAFAAPAIASAICPATSAGPPSVGVGSRDWPSTWFSASTTIASILVPPRSIPPRRSPLSLIRE